MLSVADLDDVGRDQLLLLFPEQLMTTEQLRYAYCLSLVDEGLIYHIELGLVNNPVFASYYLLPSRGLDDELSNHSLLGIELRTGKRYIDATILASLEDSELWKYVSMFDKANVMKYQRFAFSSRLGLNVYHNIRAGLTLPTLQELTRMNYLDLLSLPSEFNSVLSSGHFLLMWQREHKIIGQYASLDELKDVIGESEDLRCSDVQGCATLAARTGDVALFRKSIEFATIAPSVIKNVRTPEILRELIQTAPDVITQYTYHLIASVVNQNSYHLLSTLLEITRFVFQPGNWQANDWTKSSEKVVALLRTAINGRNVDIIDLLFSRYRDVSEKDSVKLIGSAIKTHNLEIIRHVQRHLGLTDELVASGIWASGDPNIISKYPDVVGNVEKIQSVLRGENRKESKELLENVLNAYEATRGNSEVEYKHAMQIIRLAIYWRDIEILRRIWKLFATSTVRAKIDKIWPTITSAAIDIEDGYAIINEDLVHFVINNILTKTAEVIKALAEYIARNSENDIRYFKLVADRYQDLDWAELRNVAKSVLNYKVVNYIDNLG